MNIPDHISESLETIFGFKILKFFDVDPEKFLSGIRDKSPGAATLRKIFSKTIKPKWFLGKFLLESLLLLVLS
jgi:hypothetical protein